MYYDDYYYGYRCGIDHYEYYGGSTGGPRTGARATGERRATEQAQAQATVSVSVSVSVLCVRRERCAAKAAAVQTRAKATGAA